MAPKRRKNARLPLVLISIGTLAAILAAVWIGRSAREDRAAMARIAPSPAISAAPAIAGSPTPAPTPVPTPTPTVDPYIVVRPMPEEEGYLPIFEEGNLLDRQICITVDDCFQAENLSAILDLCETYNAKITIFPIGRNTVRKGLAAPLRRAYQMGMQFENHSYSHSAFYRLSDAKLAEEICKANDALSQVLGVDYQMHFMRTRGGDNRYDLRTHQYIAKLGYYGMAHWSFNGSKSSEAALKDSLDPGQIYLFHTTDTDLRLIGALMRAASEAGYQMLTLNEMFGYPPNECREIEGPIADRTPTEPDPYIYSYKLLEKGDYLWDVCLLQRRLIELGWLEGRADGAYGKGTYMAVGYFQQAAGIKANGKATPEMQAALFAEDAPRPSAQANIGTTPVPTTAPRNVDCGNDIDMTIFD